MDSPTGPDGLPAVFDGGVWRSQDRRFMWNGGDWVATHQSTARPWMVKLGAGLVLLALLGYAVYTTMATKSEFAVGYYVGVIVFFAILFAVYRIAGRWGWFGVVIRAGCVLLALLKVLTLIAHPPPA
jgi:hypothetical protein